MAGAVAKLVQPLLAGQRIANRAAEVQALRADRAAVAESRHGPRAVAFPASAARSAGEAHFGKQRLHVRCEAARVGERFDVHAPVQQRGGGAVLGAELSVQAAPRVGTSGAPVLGLDRQMLHVLGAHSMRVVEVERGFGEPLHVDLCGESLDVKAGVRDPWDKACSKTAGHDVPVDPSGKQAVCVTAGGFEDIGMAGVAASRQEGRFDAHASCVAGVCGLHHGAGVGGQATGSRGRDAERHPGLVRAQRQHPGRGGGAAQRSHHARRVEPRRHSCSGPISSCAQTPLYLPPEHVRRDDVFA